MSEQTQEQNATETNKRNLVQEEWEKFSKSMFDNVSVSHVQYREMKKAFVAGMLASHMAVMQISDQESDEKAAEEMGDFMNNIIEENIALQGNPDLSGESSSITPGTYPQQG